MIHNRSLLAIALSRTIIIIACACISVQTYFTAFLFFADKGAKKQIVRHTTSIILIFLLLFNMFCGIKRVSANAKNGKIASFRLAERGGHRLKAALERVAWFAREQLWRHRRPRPPLSGHECAYSMRMRVVPRKGCLSSQCCGMRGLFYCHHHISKLHLKG